VLGGRRPLRLGGASGEAVSGEEGARQWRVGALMCTRGGRGSNTGVGRTPGRGGYGAAMGEGRGLQVRDDWR
jgi:hypothetical protein